MLAGRASVDGDRYVEVLRAAADDDADAGEATHAGRGDWQLGRGRIEGRLETRPIARTARREQLESPRAGTASPGGFTCGSGGENDTQACR